MSQENQSYLQFNSLTRVSNIKLDSNIQQFYTLEQVRRDKDNMRSTTVLYNIFNKMIDANYYAPELITSGAKYSIYRKTLNQYYYDYVYTLENGQVSCLDYNIQNFETYKYLACIEKTASDGSVEYLMYENHNEETGESYLTQVHWNEWSICNIEESSSDPSLYFKIGNVWRLGLNIEGEDLTHNRNITTWDTLGRYAKTSLGEKSYDSGVFTGLLGNMKEYDKRYYDNEAHKWISASSLYDSIDDKWHDVKTYEYTEKIYLEHPYAREVEKMRAWKDFCEDGSLKLLKDVKGNSWIIQIVDNPTRSINTVSNLMQTTISFMWFEVADVSKVSIINVDY